jgi:hypothetical protein
MNATDERNQRRVVLQEKALPQLRSPGVPGKPDFGLLGWSPDHRITGSPDLFGPREPS